MDSTRVHQHEVVVSIRRVRLGVFMERYGNDIVQGGIRDGVCVEVVLWQLQESLSEFVLVTERATDEVTRFVALTAKYLESWLACRDSLKVGNPIFIDVEGCDWIPFWAATGKNQYFLEGQRRLEQLNDLDPWMLEYYRYGRFVRFTVDRHCTIHDDHCEKHNFKIKRTPKDPNLPQVQSRSKHLHFDHA